MKYVNLGRSGLKVSRLPWRIAIDVMHQIDVNMVRLKPSQTVLAGLANMISRKTAIVRTWPLG